MATYDYKCIKCENEQEEIHGINEKPEIKYTLSAAHIILMKSPSAMIQIPAGSLTAFIFFNTFMRCQTMNNETNGIRKPWL